MGVSWLDFSRFGAILGLCEFLSTFLTKLPYLSCFLFSIFVKQYFLNTFMIHQKFRSYLCINLFHNLKNVSDVFFVKTIIYTRWILNVFVY